MTQAPNKFAALDKKVSDAHQVDAGKPLPAQPEQAQPKQNETKGPAQAGDASKTPQQADGLKPQIQPGSATPAQ